MQMKVCWKENYLVDPQYDRPSFYFVLSVSYFLFLISYFLLCASVVQKNKHRKRIIYKMDLHQKIAFKNKLKQVCQAIIEERIEAAKMAMGNAQQAANEEEKSSAGDKYETSRAMGHLENEMHARHLAENIKELVGLHSINTDVIYAGAAPGAFVKCADVSFFMAAGLGKQVIDGKTILLLSPQAPLSKLLQYKKAGDSFLFNGVNKNIIDVY
jgi:hypothetical protein